jgi:hypothetical protein
LPGAGLQITLNGLVVEVPIGAPFAKERDLLHRAVAVHRNGIDRDADRRLE